MSKRDLPLTRDVIDEFLADVSLRLRPTTVRGFSSTLIGPTQKATKPRHGIPIRSSVGMHRIDLVKPAEWIAAFNACHPSPHHSMSAKKRGAAAFNGLLEFAERQGYISNQTVTAARRTGFKVNRRPVNFWLTPEHLSAVELVVDRPRFDDFQRFIYRLFIETGIRPSEALSARRRDLDLRRSALHIPAGKGSGDGKERWVPVTDAFIAEWTAHADGYGLKGEHHVVFARWKRLIGGATPSTEWEYEFRKPIGATTLGEYFEAFLDEFRVMSRSGEVDPLLVPSELTPRTVRRSYACLQLILDALGKGGLTLHQLARALGHESVATTEIYLSDVEQYIGQTRRPTDTRTALAALTSEAAA